MSQYQYYEFLAVDRPLTSAETDELRKLSVRAEITPTGLVSTYYWGSFQGDPEALVERYFDAFLYLANWGTRQLMIRLPIRVLDPATARSYCGDQAAVTWATGDHVMLSYTSVREHGSDEDWEGGGHWLAAILPARAELVAGDLRLLYLGWLLAAQSGGLDDDELEPPVPPGLGRFGGALRRFTQFLRVDDDLIEVATTGGGRTRRRAAGAGRRSVAELLYAADTLRLERERAERRG